MNTMTHCIGTKQVRLLPMTRAAYNDYRGWTLPADEDGADEGYLVEYLDGGEPNHPDHAGYISWSPKAQADAAYRPVTAMTFGDALVMLKAGKRVARAGWNGKGMWIIMTPGRVVNNLEPNSFYERCGFEAPVTIGGHIDMRAADGTMVVGWLASQTDMLAEDWQLVE